MLGDKTSGKLESHQYPLRRFKKMRRRDGDKLLHPENAPQAHERPEGMMDNTDLPELAE